MAETLSIPPRRSLYSYAWDIAESGVSSFVEEVRGAGLNSVTLACAYHGGKFLRPRGTTGRLAFPEDGTVYFRHRPERYGALVPAAERRLGAEDVLADLVASGMLVTAWMVINNNARLGRAYPEATTETAFGDRVIDSLCPANPAVREYAVALCTDIADTYGIEAIVLEAAGYKPLGVGPLPLNANVARNDWLLNTLGLCFCRHCRDRAGESVDTESLRQRVRSRVAASFDAEGDPDAELTQAWWSADSATDADLMRFIEMRRETVTTLVRDIRAALPDSCRLKVIPAQRKPVAAGWADGMDVVALAGACDGLEATLYHSRADAIVADARDLRRRVGETVRLGGVIRPAFPDHRSAEAVSAAVRGVRAAGFQDVAFYNYGRMPRHCLDWIAMALATP